MQNPFALYNKKIQKAISRKTNFVAEDLMVLRHVSQAPSDSKIHRQRVAVLFFCILISFLLIFGKLLYLQVTRGQYYRTVAEGNRIRIHERAANRGIIYDRNKNILAENTYTFILNIIPVDVSKDYEERSKLIENIERITGKEKHEIEEIIKGIDPYSYRPVPLDENLNYQQAIEARLLSADFSGVVIDVGTKRVYHNADARSISHILGYLGKVDQEDLQSFQDAYSLTDSRGKAGVEFQYENLLRGVKGRQQVEVDALGQKVDIIAEQEPKPGKNLVLTIDKNIQSQLEDMLSQRLQTFHKSRASAIVLDVDNSEVLAMINLPTFDNNIFTTGITKEDFNSLLNDTDKPLFLRSIQGTYPSGSTIKPILAAAALQEEIVTPYTQVLSSGGIRINEWFFPDWKSGGHGYTHITKALAESVNTYFYMIGGGYKDFEGLGLEKIYKYYRGAGVGELLGIDLPGEDGGLLPTAEWKKQVKGESWYIGDTYHISIGQGDILVTPLQVASWTAMVANGGKLYKPRVLYASVDPQTGVTKEVESELLNSQFVYPKHLEVIRRGLRDAVMYGSAKSLYELPIMVAGKTGTAQWSSKFENHAWFTSFSPYGKPEIVLTILVEEGGEGNGIPVLVAKDFYRWYADYRQQTTTNVQPSTQQ